MKTNLHCHLISFFLFIFLSSIVSKTIACVDYHPVPPAVTAIVDSGFSKLEITVHELNIFAGSSGDFCTCGLSAYSNLFSSIYYVAFVDSGTSNPIPGFDIWNSNANSTSAWSGVMTGNTWSGFVAEVIATMTPGQAVELIIKINIPPGFATIAALDSALSNGGTNLGTDAWDNTNNVLTNSHNSISPLGAVTYFIVSPNYFTGINEIEETQIVKVFPNPTSGNKVINLLLNNATIGSNHIRIIDVTGKMVKQIPLEVSSKDEKLKIDVSDLSKGFYTISLDGKNKLITTSFVLN